MVQDRNRINLKLDSFAMRWPTSKCNRILSVLDYGRRDKLGFYYLPVSFSFSQISKRIYRYGLKKQFNSDNTLAYNIKILFKGFRFSPDQILFLEVLHIVLFQKHSFVSIKPKIDIRFFLDSI